MNFIADFKHVDVARVRGPSSHTSVMFRRETYEKVGGYRAQFNVAQDLDLWMRLAEVGVCWATPEILCERHLSKNSISAIRRDEQMRSAKIIVKCAAARRSGRDDSSVGCKVDTAAQMASILLVAGSAKTPGGEILLFHWVNVASSSTETGPALFLASRKEPGFRIQELGTAFCESAGRKMKPPVFDENWSEEIKALYRHDVQEIWDQSLNRHIWNQYHNQLRIYLELAGFPELTGERKILDVGCAQGTLALLLAERGHDVVALDLRPGFLEYAQTRYTHGRIRFVAGNALECELDERFDLVFANQIIEHLVYPERLIGRLKGLLNAGGKLVVTTPNWHYVRNNLPSFEEIGDPAQFEHLQFTADGDGHFFAYKADELVNIFTNAGLRNIASIFFESPFISGHLKLRYLHKLVPLRLLYALDYSALALPLRRYLAHQLMIVAEH